MCGAFSVMACGEEKNYFRLGVYQVGRLISYLLLTSLAFTISRPILELTESLGLKWLATGIYISLLIFWIYLLLFHKSGSIKPPAFALNVFRKIRNTKKHTFSFLLGLSTTLLPCIWLYGFVALAATKTHFLESLATITFFWLGTIPSLCLVQIFSIKIQRKMGHYLKPLAVVVILFLSGFSMYSRLQVNSQPPGLPQKTTCH